MPKTVVAEAHEFVGAGPESMLLKHVQDAAKGPDVKEPSAVSTQPSGTTKPEAES